MARTPPLSLVGAMAAALITSCVGTLGPPNGSGGGGSTVGGSSGGGAGASGGGAAGGAAGGASGGGTAGAGGGQSATGGGGQGTAGGGAAGSGGGTGTSPCDRVVAWLCDDFEAGDAGDFPLGPWIPNGQVRLSTQRAFSGSRSVQVDEGFGPLSVNLSPARDVLFARVMMWSSFSGSTQDSRQGIVRVTSGDGHHATTDMKPQLIAFHYYPNGESATASTVPVPTGQWVCLEIAYDRTTRVFRAWVNGTAATELESPLTGPPIDGGWTAFALRNEIIHGGSASVFYDDVALGTARLGCP